MCGCIKRIEEEIKEQCQSSYKKPIHHVRCAGVMLSLNDGKSRLTTTFNVTLEGQKKEEQLKIATAFCPFCGEKF